MPRLRLALPVLALTALATTLPSTATAGELRFSTTAKGGVVSTGNTLGLAKQQSANGPGTEDSIGTFLSIDPQSVDDFPANGPNPWGPGTTYDWMDNASSAQLPLPVESSNLEILYAELVWGGSYEYGTENVSASLNVPVTLEAEGDMLDVSPDMGTAVTLAEVAGGGFLVRYYMRSAEVTAFVAQHLSASYTVSGVPATQDTSINSLNAAGWTLVVAYRTPSAPTRNLAVFVGGQFVDEDTSEDYPVSGFCTPPQGTVEGAAVISAIEGDADLTGDVFQIAESMNGPFATLSGPNNPIDNFFASQINGIDGSVDMFGSAGDLNHDAFAGTNLSGGRQGWDVTKVALSSTDGQLGNDQTSAVLRAVTTGDSFMPVLAAFEIDVSSPDFEAGSMASAAPEVIGLGQTTEVSFEITNSGEADAGALSFTAPLPAGLDLVSFTTDGVEGDINQQPVDASDLGSGVDLGAVAAGDNRSVVLTLEASGAPAGDSWNVVGTWAYDFVSCVGEDPLAESSVAVANVGFDGDGGDGDGDPTGDGDGDSTTGDGDGDSSSEGTDGESDGTDTDDPIGTTGFGADRGLDDEGCNCTSGPDQRGSGWLALGLLGLAGLVRRRRR